MRLFLARHGNTFNPSEKPLWVGNRSDLPLVEMGYKQAEDLGSRFKALDIKMQEIFCSPLKRTYQFAERIIQIMNSSVEIQKTEALNEIDYGDWEGKSNEEISELGFERELSLWSKNSVWPNNANWSKQESEVVEEVLNYAKQFETTQGDFLCVSSNGRLRYFCKLIQGEFEKRAAQEALKMRTGNLSLMEYSYGKWIIKFWNLSPDEITLEML